MGRYIVRRLLLMIPTLFIVSLLVFFLMRIVPGDAVDAQLGQAAAAGGGVTPELEAQIRAELGLDRPAHIQYFVWVGNALQGDLGNSLQFKNRTVWSELRVAIPVSLEIAIMALIISLMIAIPFGVLSAIYQDSWIDYLSRIISVGGLSIPDFVVATVIIVMPAIWWGWLPPLGYVAFFDDPGANLVQFILPSAAIGLRFSSTTLRMVRSSMLEVLRADYVRTARAKGLTSQVVIVRHALKNAMIAPITLIGTSIGFLIGGTFIVETIFALPGVGRLTLDSISNRDYNQLQGNVLFLSTVFVMVNLVTDLTYAWFDPRIRYS
ncbi:MAG: ABC transporter permease [Chloroflexi bacterium]|nr:ABC transporter permease [Chloroflexota bacterium]